MDAPTTPASRSSHPKGASFKASTPGASDTGPDQRSEAKTPAMPYVPESHDIRPSLAVAAPPALQTAEPVSPKAPPLIRPLPKDQQPLPEARVPGHGLKVIGQYDNLYLFCQSADGGLLVVDQHAAHERLLFEDLKQQFMQGHIASQALLFPATVELSIAETEYVEHYTTEIKQMGFTVREFGGNSFIISAVPAMAGQCDPGELFLDILARFGNAEEKKGRGSILDDILASMACKGAVKAGDTLHAREIDALLTRMTTAELFSHCPHGRPVLKHFTATEVKKWFHRT